MYDFERKENDSGQQNGFVLSGEPYDPEQKNAAAPDTETSRPETGHTPHTQKKKSEKRPFVRAVCLALCCALIGGAAGAGTVLALGGGSVRILQSGRTGPAGASLETLTVAEGEALTYSQIYSLYSPSVVSVAVETSSGTGAGTGFVISEDGYLLTCYHVVDGAKAISVTFNDGADSAPAEYVGGDAEQDVAVLKIDPGERELTPVVFGDSGLLGVGDTVTSIGNALGTLANTTTTGIVSATNRAISMSDGAVMNLLQTDCTVNSGNSGGPLFNAFGEVIGIVNAKYSGSTAGGASGASIEGIGFAIPINSVKEILPDLIEHGYVTGKPYLGITVSTVSSLTAQRYSGYVVGAYVNSVEKGSCAEEAGLQQGDIITAVDQTEITSSAELIDAKNNHRAGEQMELTVYRGGESLLIVVTLDEEQPQADDDTSEEEPQQDNGSTQDGYYSYEWPYGSMPGFFGRGGW